VFRKVLHPGSNVGKPAAEDHLEESDQPSHQHDGDLLVVPDEGERLRNQRVVAHFQCGEGLVNSTNCLLQFCQRSVDGIRNYLAVLL
jgi:hypothetical protein